ncbi:Mu transposase C-terminal domain-containing protein [Psychrobacillus sp. FJAT-51614]|uniref:Mu transposase C-terminal domain-containing protein n=1 Tax=Psychrobacillus mangrovi TaxID=3117745 RepID=A0ABU8F8U3_9BACI
MRLYIGIGTRFKLNERFFEVEDELERNVYLAKDLEFGTVKKKFSLTELYKYLEAGTLQFQHGDKDKKGVRLDFQDFSMLPVSEQEDAKYKYFVIEPLLEVKEQKLRPYIKDRIEKLLKQGYEVSERSIYRWLLDYKRSDGSIHSLVSNTRNSGPKEKMLQAEVELIIDEVLETYYQKRERVRAVDVHHAVINKIDLKNLERKEDEEKLRHPSISTIKRRIDDTDSYDRDIKRLGHAEARKKHGSSKILDKPKHPLERVEIDHTKLDLILVDKNGNTLQRPTVTTALDKYTGYPLGVYVGHEDPSYTAVMYCLLHAFAPKTYLKERFPSVKGEWLAYGLPELLVTDRGKEFKSKHLYEACFQLDVQVVHNPPRKPWYKGSIERHFRTLNEGLVHQLPGTTFSNVVKKGDYDSEKNAALTLEDFLELLHIFIVDIYAKQKRGNKLSPAKMWEKAVDNGFTPAIPPSKLDWKVALMKLEYGSIQSTGIRMNHLFYQSEELKALRIKLGVKGKGNKVKFKYDPSDLSKIYVYDELNLLYVEALNTDQEYSRNLNEYSHNLFVKEARIEANGSVNLSEIAAAKARSREKVESANLTKRERQQAARMAGDGSNKLLQNKEVAEEVEGTPEEEKEIVESATKIAEVSLEKTEYYENEEIDDTEWEAVHVKYS